MQAGGTLLASWVHSHRVRYGEVLLLGASPAQLGFSCSAFGISAVRGDYAPRAGLDPAPAPSPPTRQARPRHGAPPPLALRSRTEARSPIGRQGRFVVMEAAPLHHRRRSRAT